MQPCRGWGASGPWDGSSFTLFDSYPAVRPSDQETNGRDSALPLAVSQIDASRFALQERGRSRLCSVHIFFSFRIVLVFIDVRSSSKWQPLVGLFLGPRGASLTSVMHGLVREYEETQGPGCISCGAFLPFSFCYRIEDIFAGMNRLQM